MNRQIHRTGNVSIPREWREKYGDVAWAYVFREEDGRYSILTQTAFDPSLHPFDWNLNNGNLAQPEPLYVSARDKRDVILMAEVCVRNPAAWNKG